MSRRQRLIAIVAGVVVAALAGGAAYAAVLRKPTITITAHFPSALGLYAHNNVDILGVPVGTVTDISPQGAEVVVTMHVPADTKIPADALAVIMSPNPVSDRFVEFSPPYNGSGAVLGDGADIPIARTRTPVEVDKILSTVDDLAKALGPSGANAKGTLQDLLHVAAQTLGGNGQSVHDVIDGLSRALPALTANGPQISDLLTNLDVLTKALADHNATLASFLNDLAGASSLLASERQDLATALSTLQTALAQLVTFVEQNRGALGADLTNLATVTTTLLKHQQQLIEGLDTTPLALGNFADAVDPTTGLLHARIITPQGYQTLPYALCGDPTPRIAQAIRDNPVPNAPQPGKGNIINVACPLLEALIQQPSSPGAPAIPLDLQQFIGGSP